MTQRNETQMNETQRNGFRWSVNECLQLQREFELLELSIDEIASRHKRTPNAIMYKLDQEGFADYNVLYSNYYDLNAHMKLNCNQDYDTEEEDDSDEDDDTEEEEEEEEENDSDEDDKTSLKNHIIRLEKRLNEFMELMLSQSKTNKSLFSVFG